MIATTEETLHDLFKAAILAISPRITYKGAAGWKPYEKAKDGGDRTRAFRLIWSPPELRTGGAVFGSIFEHEAELRVRTDYAGQHDKTQFAIVDDHVHLRDVLSALKASDNGLQLVEPIRLDRRGSSEDDDVIQIDHVYSVRFMRSIDP